MRDVRTRFALLWRLTGAVTRAECVWRSGELTRDLKLRRRRAEKAAGRGILSEQQQQRISELSIPASERRSSAPAQPPERGTINLCLTTAALLTTKSRLGPYDWFKGIIYYYETLASNSIKSVY